MNQQSDERRQVHQPHPPSLVDYSIQLLEGDSIGLETILEILCDEGDFFLGYFSDFLVLPGGVITHRRRWCRSSSCSICIDN